MISDSSLIRTPMLRRKAWVRASVLDIESEKTSLAAIEDVLRAAFEGSTLVNIAAGDAGAVEIEENAGTDRLTLRVCGNDAVGHARLIATLDNLGKGASGAAVQNLNLMLGVSASESLAA